MRQLDSSRSPASPARQNRANQAAAPTPLEPSANFRLTSRSSRPVDAVANTPVAQRQRRRFVRQVLRITNRLRRREGLRPLKLNNKLKRTAQAHSQDMAGNDFFSHTGSNGSSVGDRFRRVGYRYSLAAENAAAGSSTARGAVNQWLNSPGHRANMLNPSFRHIGIGYANVPNDSGNERWGHYWTQTFGRPMR